MQMAISPHLIFNMWQSARDWCLGENVLPHHLHNQQIFPFWLLVLSSIMEQWKILVKGGSSGSSSSLTTDKSTIEVNAVSVETVVSCDCITSLAVAGPTRGRWGALILKLIDRDEPAQCFPVAYASAAAMLWDAGCCFLMMDAEKNICVWRE
jgi:hypothetical protein